MLRAAGVVIKALFSHHFFQGFSWVMTRGDPARGSGQEVFPKPAVRVESGQEVFKISRVESGRVKTFSKCHGLDRITMMTRSDPREEI